MAESDLGSEYLRAALFELEVAHYAIHVGQIVFLAKHLAGASWKSQSIPRGPSGLRMWSYGKPPKAPPGS